MYTPNSNLPWMATQNTVKFQPLHKQMKTIAVLLIMYSISLYNVLAENMGSLKPLNYASYN